MKKTILLALLCLSSVGGVKATDRAALAAVAKQTQQDFKKEFDRLLSGIEIDNLNLEEAKTYHRKLEAFLESCFTTSIYPDGREYSALPLSLSDYAQIRYAFKNCKDHIKNLEDNNQQQNQKKLERELEWEQKQNQQQNQQQKVMIRNESVKNLYNYLDKLVNLDKLTNLPNKDYKEYSDFIEEMKDGYYYMVNSYENVEKSDMKRLLERLSPKSQMGRPIQPAAGLSNVELVKKLADTNVQDLLNDGNVDRYLNQFGAIFGDTEVKNLPEDTFRIAAEKAQILMAFRSDDLGRVSEEKMEKHFHDGLRYMNGAKNPFSRINNNNPEAYGFDKNDIERAKKESLSERHNPGNFVDDNATIEEIWARITEKDSNAGQPVKARSRSQLALKKGGAAAKQLKTRFSREIWKQDQIDQLWDSVASNFREIIGTTSAADPFTDFKNIIDETLQNKYSTYSTEKDTNFKNIEGFFYGPKGIAFDNSFKIKDKVELLTVMKNAQNYALCVNIESVTDKVSKLVNFVKNTSKVNLLVGDVNKKISNKISDLSKKFGLSGEEMKSVIDSAQPVSLGQIKDVVKKWIPESVDDTAPVNVVINLQKHLGKKSEELSNLLFTVFQKKSPVDYEMLTASKKKQIKTLFNSRIEKLIKSAENTDVAAKIKSDSSKKPEKQEPTPAQISGTRYPGIETLWV